MKLGNRELELKQTDIKSSVLEGRKLFFHLILEKKIDTVRELQRFYNFDCLPNAWQESYENIKEANKIFLLHSTNKKYYDFDVSKLGFDQNIRNTPVLHFFKFLFSNSVKHQKLLKRSQEECKEYSDFVDPKIVNEMAIDYLIPDWKALQTEKNLTGLCNSIREWAERWSLNDDWCLDFALEVLKAVKIEFTDCLNIDERYLQELSTILLIEFEQFCEEGKAWEYALYNLTWNNSVNIAVSASQIKKYPAFKFQWMSKISGKKKSVFEIEARNKPFSITKEKFVSYVEKQMWTSFFANYNRNPSLLVGKIEEVSKNFKTFKSSLEKYVNKNRAFYKDIAIPSVEKSSGDKHFRWLIDYQLSKLSSTQIANKEGVTRKAVELGIKDASKLIGLALRPRNPSGRPTKPK
jgi:hypothetical protein